MVTMDCFSYTLFFLYTTHIHRNDYVTTLVFDLGDDNTTGTLAIHPLVEEAYEMPCEERPPQPPSEDKPNSSNNMLLLLISKLLMVA